MAIRMRVFTAFPVSLMLAVSLLAAACASPPEAPSTSPAEPVVVVPAGETPPLPAGGEEQFVVTQEVYSRTFDEVERFVRTLNEIIRREDYDTWVTFLSAEYVSRTSDPLYLQQQSEKPLLKQNNIQLRTLRDYFDHVVVPSRVLATVNEIEFIDKTHVKAITAIRNTRAVLFLLVREDGNWKIGVW
jgi:hypothetical protein